MYLFFQAEDGIRVYKVTGVQTCALPICPLVPLLGDVSPGPHRAADRLLLLRLLGGDEHGAPDRERRLVPQARSEERRVGNVCGSRWSTYMSYTTMTHSIARMNDLCCHIP